MLEPLMDRSDHRMMQMEWLSWQKYVNLFICMYGLHAHRQMKNM